MGLGTLRKMVDAALNALKARNARPPMGWHCFGSSVTEAQFLANLDAFVEHLQPAEG